MGSDCAESREAVVPHVLNIVEKTLDRLVNITDQLVERTKTVTTCLPEAKTEEAPAPSHGVPMAERIARIDEGLEHVGGRLQDVLDRLEI